MFLDASNTRPSHKMFNPTFTYLFLCVFQYVVNLVISCYSSPDKVHEVALWFASLVG